ncbi:MAG: biotin carboxylase N-terminal domain-containing protein [Flavobacteriaceae bacterium]
MSELALAARPIRSVLVANRGEIACRVFATCRRMNIRTIAVYSDADAGSLHVRSADEAVRIGGPAAADSYLDIDALLEAARATNADAVHPGYGFLSENAGFAGACEEAGIIFIGPSAASIASMGSKIAAKRIAINAGVPTVPGYHGGEQSVETLRAEAGKIGYPVLIKASAGGGGRGMRVVSAAEDFEAELATAKAEARSAFGDDAVLLEKFIANPRHLEVQLLGDEHGNLVHLFERDCSVQRNNQKVLEEAPAPNLHPKVREKLFEAALTLGRAMGYRSAGTVEFIMDANGREPYFLEMNTRLQVEHPVTEAITGLDLVEWQLRVAAGERLPESLQAIRPNGHAIEARLTAERPDMNFAPSLGTFSRVAAPRGVRFDTGIDSGAEIGPHYDSMVAKLIAHGGDRQAALARLSSGLEGLVLLGPPTNQAFLRDCVARPEFAEGRATTRFIAGNFPGGWKPEGLTRLRAFAGAIWAVSLGARGGSLWQSPNGFRVTARRRPAGVALRLEDDYGEADLRVLLGPDGIDVAIGEETVRLPAGIAEETELDGKPVAFRAEGGFVQVSHDALSLTASIVPTIDLAGDAAGSAAGDGTVTAPLYGLVTELAVSAGERVEAGATLLVMEAMKLVHKINAPVSGVVSSIRCAAGDTVPAKTVLLEITEDEE